MRICLPVLATLFLTSPVMAQDPLAEASGNWAGESNQGFFFRAELLDVGDAAGLRIWNGNDGVPQGGDPQLDVSAITWRDNLIEPGEQRLEVFTTSEGTSLNVVTESADEHYGVREAIVISYLDNQFTVTGYYYAITSFQEPSENFECDAGLWVGEATVNGERVQVPDLPFEDLNASLWHRGRAVELGYCPPVS